MIKSHFKKFATLSLSAALFAGIGITAAAGASTPLPAQSPAIAFASSVSATGTAGTAVTLASTGGAGGGAVSFTAKGKCAVTGTSLNATAPGDCVVTVTKAADSSHAASTANKTITFAAASQSTFAISNSVLTGKVNTPLTLTTTGLKTTKPVKFATSSTNCAIKKGNTVVASAPATCVVTASSLASGVYAAASDNATFTFTYQGVDAFVINNVGTSANATKGVAITTYNSAGAADKGKISFSATGTGCTISTKGLLTSSGAGVCHVTATQAAYGPFGAQTTASQNFTMNMQAIAYSAHLTGLTANGTAVTPVNINGDSNGGGDKWFLNSFFSSLDNWTLGYVPAGSTVVETWTITDGAGKAVKSLPVKFESLFGGANSATWTQTSTAPAGDYLGTAQQSGTTSPTGTVSFTLHNTNSVSGLNPNDESAAALNANEDSYPWTRGVLIVGTPSAAPAAGNFTSTVGSATQTWGTGGTPTQITQVTDLVDLIVVPGSTAKKAQATLTVSNSVTHANNGQTISLTSAGGSGSGAVTFAATGTGCSVSGAVLSLAGNNSGTCSVTVTKAADATYAEATSAAVPFTFGAAADAPTNANPDVATLTSVTGTHGAQLDNTVAGDIAFINAYYNPNDHWYLNYLVAGSTVTETWHVTGSYGQNLANAAVTLIVNQAYSGSAGTTWSDTGLTGVTGATIAGTTNAQGNVTFTLHNTNAVSGYNPSVTDNAGTAASQEGTYPWTRTTLQVGSDNFSDGNTSNIVQQTDEVDLIVIPGVTAPACGNHCPTNATPDVASLTSITGITGSSLDNSATGATEFINQYFMTGDSWSFNYLAEGAAVVEHWHVTFNGSPLANTAVTLFDNQAYSGSRGTTWSDAALNVNNGTAPGGSLSGTTDSNGNVSFTLTNSNTDTGTAPTNDQLTTAANAETYEHTATLWTRTYLVVGNDSIGNGGNQKTDFTDLIVIPATASANACASATTPTASCPDVVTVAITGSGLQNSTPLDNTANALGWFIGQYYNNSDTLAYSFIDAGSSVTLKYHVAGPNGAALANHAVILDPNYQGSTSLSWTPTGATAALTTGSYTWYNGTDSTYLANTDANGDVTFTFTDGTNAYAGNHVDITSVGAANDSEYFKTNSNARAVLIVDGIAGIDQGPTSVEVLPFNDFIVNPSA